MIDNCISISEKINDLSLKEAFIYTWIIPHLDDWGRISGSPRTLKALVFPMKKEITINIIENTLTRFKQMGLFLWEEINGEMILQMPFEEFNKHQHITENKRTKSKYPDISSTSPESPRISGESPESPNQFNLIKENIREENINKDTYCSDLSTDPGKSEPYKIVDDFFEEPEKPKDEKPKIPKINLNRTTWEFEGITEADIDLWCEAYPAVILDTEIKKSIAWVQGAGRKGYKSNWRKFLTGWFDRCQNSGGTKNVPGRT